MKMPLIAVALAMLGGCATTTVLAPDFLASLTPYCGRAYVGRIVSPPVPADEAFAGKALIMHVASCTEDTVRIPFHVGDDHSRTWVLSRTAVGLRLKHDHRHADGTEDRVTQYGGDSSTPPAAPRHGIGHPYRVGRLRGRRRAPRAFELEQVERRCRARLDARPRHGAGTQRWHR